MITRISEMIAQGLVQSGTIADNEMDLYSYGFFLILSRTLFFSVTILFGIILGELYKSIAFYLLFSSLRGYAGGVHAPSEHICLIFTTIGLFFSITVLHLLSYYRNATMAAILILVSSGIIWKYCPVDSLQKPLSALEIRYYRRISRTIILVSILISLGSTIWGCFSPLYVSATAFAFESILLLAGKPQNNDCPT